MGEIVEHNTTDSLRRGVLTVLLLTFLTSLISLPVNAASRSTRDITESSSASDTPIVVLLTSGLSWATFDASSTPALAQLAEDGTAANMVPLAPRGGSCPVDSWLTMAAGKQASAQALVSGIVCPRVYAGAATTVPWWQEYSESASGIGSFASLLAGNDVTTQAIGTGAAYVLANHEGYAPASYMSSPDSAHELARAVAQSVDTHTLTIVDADAAAQVQQAIPTGSEVSEAYSDPEADEAAALTLGQINSRRIDTVLESLPSDTRVIVVSLVDGDGTNSMQLAVAGSAGTNTVASGFGFSESVRQDGVIQLTDVVPTIVSWLGIEQPSTFTGSPVATRLVDSTQPMTARIDELSLRAEHSNQMTTARGQFLRYLTWGAVGFFILSLVLLARPIYARTLAHTPARRLWEWLGVTISAVPLASLIVNTLGWWESSHPRAVLGFGSWLLAAVIAAALLYALPTNRIGVLLGICAMTSVYIAVDAATGSQAMADSPVGFNLLTAARFYGIGNEAYALLAAGSLIALAFLGTYVGRAWGTLLVAFLGIAVAAIDALPRYGSDFGGALSYLPALLLLLLLLAHITISFKRILGIAVITIAGASAVAVMDWLRPPIERTHLGTFVQSVIDGDVWEIVGRKLATNMRLLTSSTHRWVVAAALLFFFLALIQAFRSRPVNRATPPSEFRKQSRSSDRLAVLKRSLVQRIDSLWGWLGPCESDVEPPLSRRYPALVPAFVSAATCIALAFALNDSGIVLPGMAAILTIPPLAVAVAHDAHARYRHSVPIEKAALSQ